MRFKTSRLCAALFLALAFVFTLYGQTENSLQIVLADRESALITRATIRLKDKNGKPIREIGAEKSEDFVLNRIGAAGEYILEIESAGFQPSAGKIEIKPGRNVLSVTLEIAEIKANVEVTRAEIEKRFEEVFSRTLTVEEIEALPGNPNDIEAELKRKYGDDILIRVNGFTGGRLPPKEMIASMRVISSVFDAEFHQIGATVIDIKTRAGLPKTFGFFAFNFNDARLNARNSFASRRLPEQDKFLMAFLGGPLIKNKTSYQFSVISIDSYKKNNLVAVSPNRTEIKDEVKSGTRFVLPSIGIDHNLNKNHTLHLTYGIEKADLTNAGIGEFNLPETGFSSRTFNHRVRLSESGTIGKKYANEFRLELLDSKTSATPNTPGVAGITVLDAFTAGGASVDNENRERQLTVADNLLFDRGKHSLKIGGEIRLEQRKSFSADNTNGRFVFTSLEDYLNNRPASYTRRLSASEISLRQAQIAVYLQDDVRLSRHFQAGFGLRYERQNNLRDSNNFSPRLSFIYSPTREGKIVFRFGAGVFYQWLDAQNLASILNNDGRQATVLIIRNPGYPDPLSGGTTQNQPPPSIYRKAGDLRNPSIWVTQGGFNYRATKRLNIETFYTFRRGTHHFRSRDINAPVNNGARPNTAFGRITQLESSGFSSENSLETKLDGSFKFGVSFNARYKLAKAINNFEGIFSLPTDSYDTDLDVGFANSDRRHFLTGNLAFTLFKKLQVTPIFRFGSRLPYTIITGRDDNGDAVFNDRPAGIKRNSARGAPLRQFDLGFNWHVPLFKRANKDAESAGVPVNKASGAQSAAAMDLLKNYSIGFNVTIQNVFNQTNLQNFVGNQSSPFFRQATFSAPARQIQIGLNFFF